MTAAAEVTPLRADDAQQPAANVVAALTRVLEELPAIGKDGTAAPQQGGYAYRGIEQITRAAAPLFAKHGIVFVPSVVQWERDQITVASKPWTDDRLLVLYRVYGPGGPFDMIEVGPIAAVGRDNADKGTNKALTQAFKYALLQVLCISDAKDDADGQTHEADARPEPQGPPAPPPAMSDEHAARLRAHLEAFKGASERVQAAMRSWVDESEMPGPRYWTEPQLLAADQHLSMLIDSDDGSVGAAAQDVLDDTQPAESTAPEPTDTDGPPRGYDLWSRDDLAAECEARGLPKSGAKTKLVRELRAHDATLGRSRADEHDERPF